MITTNDVNVKETKDKKLTIITTGDVKPKEFIVRGSGKAQDRRILTTSNVDQFKRELLNEKKRLDRKKKAAIRKAKKLAKTEKEVLALVDKKLAVKNEKKEK